MQLTEHIYLVGGGSASFSLTHETDCSIYLIDGGDALALIDAGSGLDTETILRQVRQEGFDPRKVQSILLTHAHGDHAGGAMALRQSCGADVYAMEPAAGFLRRGDMEATSVSAARDAGVYPADYAFSACEAIPVSDGEILTVGKLAVRVLATPGHAAGHACYLAEADGALNAFTGDLVTHGGAVALQAIWDCELTPYLQSLQRLAVCAPERMFPGHGCFSLSNAMAQIEPALLRMRQLRLPVNALG